MSLTDVCQQGLCVNLTPLTSKRGALATDAREAVAFSLLGRAPASCAGIPGSRPVRCDGADPGGGYISMCVPWELNPQAFALLM